MTPYQINPNSTPGRPSRRALTFGQGSTPPPAAFVLGNRNYLVDAPRIAMPIVLPKFGVKRPYDSMLWDLVCSDLLFPTSAITGTPTITSDQDVGLLFGTPAVSTTAQTYSDGNIVPAAQAVQVRIRAGEIPAGSDSLGLSVPNILCTLRLQFRADQSPTQIEALFALLLIDQLPKN